jgi:hypothetical protein
MSQDTRFPSCKEVKVIFILRFLYFGKRNGAQQTKQCMDNIQYDCGRCYIDDTSRPLEVCIKEHKYNLTQDLFEKSKLAQHAYEGVQKIC